MHCTRSKAGSKPKATTGLFIRRWMVAATQGNIPMAFGLAEILRCFEPFTRPVSEVVTVTDMFLQEHTEIHHGVGQRCAAAVFFNRERWWATNFVRFGAALRCDRRRAKTILYGLAKLGLIEIFDVSAENCKKLLLKQVPAKYDVYVRPLTFALKAAFEACEDRRIQEDKDVVPDDYNHDSDYPLIPLGQGRDGCDATESRVGIYHSWHESRTRRVAMNSDPKAIDTHTWATKINPYRSYQGELRELVKGVHENIPRRAGQKTPSDREIPLLGVPRGTAVRWETVAECDGNYGKAYLLSQLRYMYPRYKKKAQIGGRDWMPCTARGLEKMLGVCKSDVIRWLHEMPSGFLLAEETNSRWSSARGHEVFHVIP